MEKAAEFRRHAEQCRAWARRMPQSERDRLMKMADAWDQLAEWRERKAGQADRPSGNSDPSG